jgi:hypothetical protein
MHNFYFFQKKLKFINFIIQVPFIVLFNLKIIDVEVD